MRRHSIVPVLLLSLGTVRANTILYTTAPGATINVPNGASGVAENANVTFITSANSLEIRVSNMQVGSGTVAQTISAVDFLLSTPSTDPVVVDFSGVTINLVDPGGKGTQNVTYTQGLAYTPTNFPGDRWQLYTAAASSSTTAGAQIAGGMQLTTLSGGNPNETIIGPPNSSDLYQANKGLLADNPLIQTSGGSYVSWTIHFSSGVTALTKVTRARLSFNTAFDTATELDLTSETPEPVSVLLSVSGLLLLVARRFLPSRKAVWNWLRSTQIGSS